MLDFFDWYMNCFSCVGVVVDEWSDLCIFFFFVFAIRRRHTRFDCDWSSDVCSSDLDPIGTILIPAMQFMWPGVRLLGWGKPVRISLSARHMTRRFRMKISHLFIAAAGPGMNILFALVLSAVFVALIAYGGMELRQYTRFVANVIMMNIGLAFFNLLPCPPLDGVAILHGLLPRILEWIADGL